MVEVFIGTRHHLPTFLFLYFRIFTFQLEQTQFYHLILYTFILSDFLVLNFVLFFPGSMVFLRIPQIYQSHYFYVNNFYQFECNIKGNKHKNT